MCIVRAALFLVDFIRLRSFGAVTKVTALAAAAAHPVGIAVTAVGSAVIFARWIFDVYQRTYVAMSRHNFVCLCLPYLQAKPYCLYHGVHC